MTSSFASRNERRNFHPCKDGEQHVYSHFTTPTLLVQSTDNSNNHDRQRRNSSNETADTESLP